MFEKVYIEIKKSVLNLKNIWKYGDSQPTEITLAAALMFLVPIVTYIEICFMPLFDIFLFFGGLYQIICVSRGILNCRVIASFITFSLYLTTLVMYIVNIGLPTPSHYGWVLLVISSFGSLKRLKTEQLHRNG